VYTHAHTHLFNQPIFTELLQVRLVPESEFLGTFVVVFLQAGCPCCYHMNSIKATKTNRAYSTHRT